MFSVLARSEATRQSLSFLYLYYLPSLWRERVKVRGNVGV
jgi:hypothetical protein